jgi:hypothetical protein
MKSKSFIENRGGRAVLPVMMATVFIIVAFSFVVIATDDSDGASPDSIVVSQLPTKVQYNKGQALDISGLKIEVTYDDVPASKVTYSYPHPNIKTNPDIGAALNTVGNQTIQVTYSEGAISKSSSFAVKVVDPDNPVLESIAVTKKPDKVEYALGEKLDTNGMEVTANFDVTPTSKPDLTYTTSPADGAAFTSQGDKTITVSCTYKGVTKTASFTVKVGPAVLASISVTTPPTKVSYNLGDKLDLAGMVVTAKLTDDTTKPATGFTTDPANDTVLNKAGTQAVVISFKDGDITKTVTLNVTVALVLDSISVTTQPTKITYTVGDKLDLTGMVVTAKYNDNSTKAVTDDCTTVPAKEAVLDKDGKVTVTISYKEGSVTKEATLELTVEKVPSDNTMIYIAAAIIAIVALGAIAYFFFLSPQQPKMPKMPKIPKMKPKVENKP